jgi:CRP/FNR family transcriptional regulator, anaerobic regulatory protein
VLESLVREAPELEHRLHRQALRELDDARDWMMTLGRKTAAERVASFLLLLVRHLDPEACSPATRFEIPLTGQTSRTSWGLTIETISRQLTRLRMAGLSASNGTGI